MYEDEITKRIEEIKKNKYDYEKAHSLEDELYIDFIKYVATLPHPISLTAKAILKTQDIDFIRYGA